MLLAYVLQTFQIYTRSRKLCAIQPKPYASFCLHDFACHGICIIVPPVLFATTDIFVPTRPASFITSIILPFASYFSIPFLYSYPASIAILLPPTFSKRRACARKPTINEQRVFQKGLLAARRSTFCNTTVSMFNRTYHLFGPQTALKQNHACHF